jgi:hypothetical protein
MKRLSITAVIALAIASLASAEKINLTPAQLRETATHVVVADVRAIYTRKESKGDWLYTHYLAELHVEASEKGDLEKDQLAYVRYWRRRWQGKGQMPTSTTGHRGLPSTGDTVRVYLARNAYDGFTRHNHDGGLNVIGANGFENVRKAG